MTLILNLRNLDARDRSHSWQKAIRDNYLDLDIRFASPIGHAGIIAQARTGAITLGALASVQQAHERTQVLMSDDVDHLLGVMQFRGKMHLAQSGRETTLSPGQLLMLDSGQPYRAEFPEDYQIMVVRIPRIYFGDAFSSKSDFVNRSIDESDGSAVVVDYFRRMAKCYDDVSSEQRVRMSAHGVRLLVGTMASTF